MFIVLAYIVLCVAIMLIARRRNRDPIGWLFIAIIITPLLAGILLFALPIWEEDTRPIDPRSGLRIDPPDRGKEMIRKMGQGPQAGDEPQLLTEDRLLPGKRPTQPSRRMSQGPHAGDEPQLLTEGTLLPGELPTRPSRRYERSKAWALFPLSIIFAVIAFLAAAVVENHERSAELDPPSSKAEKQDDSKRDHADSSVQQAQRQMREQAAEEAGVPLPLHRPDNNDRTAGKSSTQTKSEGSSEDERGYCSTTNLIVKKFIAARWGADPSIYRSAGPCLVTGKGPYRRVAFAYSTPITRKNRSEPVSYTAIVAHDAARNRYHLCQLTIQDGKTYWPNKGAICSKGGWE